MVFIVLAFPVDVCMISIWLKRTQGLQDYSAYRYVSMRIQPVNIAIIGIITILLVVVQIWLIVKIMKSFGASLKMEIYYLIIVQFFFQFGFLLRMCLDIDWLRRMWNSVDQPENWFNQY